MATILVGAALAAILYKLSRAFWRDISSGCCASGCSGCHGGCHSCNTCAAHRP